LPRDEADKARLLLISKTANDPFEAKGSLMMLLSGAIDPIMMTSCLL